VRQADKNGSACRVAVVAADEPTRSTRIAALEAAGFPVAAWAEDAEALVVLGTRVDICLLAEPPDEWVAEELRRRSATLVVHRPHARDADVVAAVRAASERRPEPRPAPTRPRLAPRQREVLVAYAVGNDVLPTVARRLGMERETFKTHLRRIRKKYEAVGRPAPTRRDLYVRALEDGLIAPPADGRPRDPAGRPPGPGTG
jgi:DNA-binding CsgD family transcriptional regulator